MANRKLRIAAQLSGKTRALLLRMVRPSLPNVYCEQVTYAYGVASDHPFPAQSVKAVIWGVHRTKDHEALLCTVNGSQARPDGKQFHITLSTADGIPPAAGGEIDVGATTEISPIEIELVFTLGNAFVSRPQPLELAA